ncbi:MAG: malonyl-CoA decarboxylase family protein [Burkholderiales bacterium]|nr:malonyl-CoA decarboxylase family protein [Burkholderiales bacterium]
MSSTDAAPDAADARSPLARISSWFKERVKTEDDPSPAGGELRAWQRELDACAREQGGPVAARARARELIDLYLAMNGVTRLEALRVFTTRLGPNPENIAAAAARHASALGSADEWQAEMALRASLASPRARVIRQFGAAPHGVRFLVDLRADLLGRLDEAPELAVLEDELALQLGDWFDVGFLELKRLSWESPAHVLEKLMQYEAVHEIRSWTDMKNRLDHDRRVYAFFHPRLKDEPLVFVEVALTEAIAGNVQAILDEGAPLFDPRRARAAMFYSISSTQEGLRGISFGNFLIKRVVEDLKRDFPRLQQFSTLSPMPGFARWLAATSGVPTALRDALARRDWFDDAKLSAELRAPLMSLAAQYLLEAKRGAGPAPAQPLDAVARFHLGNGARAERLQWLADRSPKGLSQSHGLMVNYLYDLDEIEANVTRLSTSGEVAAGPRMQRLAQIGARMRSEAAASAG